MEIFDRQLLESYLRIETERICSIDARPALGTHLANGKDETASSMTFTTSNFI
ncbi:hypothetical protein [Olivibacter domesticus]|uniref:Uncharacterized protein n=1 Tax=Olivibacter domesticus TaxID=407022 RepID=A0A1H7GIA7_OLID1|nr:hypothetical protein [Olivibacter domesticus]SEK37858.1 hypothetical protein SAMN05661044_00094 [Olivibacter domesticus]